LGETQKRNQSKSEKRGERSVAMKIKQITSEIVDLANAHDLAAVIEYKTKDSTQIDIAIKDGATNLVAIEFEGSYKWITHRLLYNAIKAKREGFSNIVFVYPFNQKTFHNSWVKRFITDELKMNMKIVHPDECLRVIEGLI